MRGHRPPTSWYRASKHGERAAQLGSSERAAWFKGGTTMSASVRLRFTLVVGVAAIALLGGRAYTQADVVDPAKNSLPNPNPMVIKGWGPLPDGRQWGSTAGIDIGPDGHVWAYDRCGSTAINGCETSNVDPILKFERNTGAVLASFGGGMIVATHGLHVDSAGNVWITDQAADSARTKG